MRLNMAIKEAGREEQIGRTNQAIFRVVLEGRAKLMEEVMGTFPGVNLVMTRAGSKFCSGMGPGQLLHEGEVGVKIVFQDAEKLRDFVDEVVRREEEQNATR